MKKLTAFYSRSIRTWKILIPAIVIMSCIDPYDLPGGKTEAGFLVVDGFLNTADGKVNVNLLRATKITTSGRPFEAGATVALEDNEGHIYPLTALDSGRYNGTAPSVETGKQYRLNIKTTGGNEYRSTFITIKSTPGITAVDWRAYPDGTQIVVDTEDTSSSTRYYRWTFVETWEYHSRYVSYWKYTGVDVDSIAGDETAPRTRDEMVDVCYRTIPSTRIFTTTTSGLTEDRVNDFQLTFLPKGTEKLSYRYSILVRQYAISKETYEYLEKLKNTSQDLSGLYAPQPSTVTGNIASINDVSEVVLGYFDAGQTTEKRIFITPQELPAHLQTVTDDNLICYLDTHPLPEDYVIVGPEYDDLGNFIGFTFTSVPCGDCRWKKGVTLKPQFWP